MPLILFLVLFVVSCRLTIPTDDEMIQHFKRNETAFNEIRDIIVQRSYGCYYPPYRIDTLYGDDFLSIKGLSENDRLILDSLLHVIGCERIFYWGKDWRKKFHVDTTNVELYIPYFAHGLSVGGTRKDFVYNPLLSERFLWETDQQSNLNELYYNTTNDTILYRKIKDDWYIRLAHDN